MTNFYRRIEMPEYIQRLLDANDQIEMAWMPDKGGRNALIVNTVDQAIEFMNRNGASGNLYTTIQAPTVNCRLIGDNRPLANDDISHYTRLFFDFDPVRMDEKGNKLKAALIPSSNEELFEAKMRAEGVAAFLAGEYGWPDPIIAMSGNGYHLHYLVDLKNTAKVRGGIDILYRGLHAMFDDDVVSFDRSVKNPARICTLYGTMKRKGESTDERPHRESWVEVPRGGLRIVSRNSLLLLHGALRNRLLPDEPRQHRVVRPQRKGLADWSTLDIVAWFRDLGLYKRRCTSKVHAVRCPWHGGHSDGRDEAFIAYPNRPGIWAKFFCHHNSCADRWLKDVMDMFGYPKNYAREWTP